MSGAERVDAHHHLWHYDAGEFGWISDEMAALRRDFAIEELEREMAAAGVDGCVAVQARQSVAETEFLLSVAEHPGSRVLGVVGWLPIAEPGFATVLEHYVGREKLRGLRHIVQAEPAGFLEGAAFNRGVEAMRGTGLVYDLLLHAGQIAEATRFVDRHPAQVFVLDHLGKPRIASGEMEPWRAELRELARRPGVFCKISGMVTEARWPGWTEAELQPYFDVALQAFGPDRLMVGTDWPVLTVAGGYREWWRVIDGWLGGLSESERAAVRGGTATRAYRLRPRAAVA